MTEDVKPNSPRQQSFLSEWSDIMKQYTEEQSQYLTEVPLVHRSKFIDEHLFEFEVDLTTDFDTTKTKK